MILGAHVSTQGGVDNAPANAEELDIKAIQIFSKNQRQWVAKPLEEEAVNRWHEEMKRVGITHQVSHTSYLINLCAPDDEKREKSLDSLVDELERGERLGLTHVVLHPGSHLKEGEEWGLTRIAESLDIVHERTAGFKVKVALENTAGQGTNLGYTFEHLKSIMEQTREHERLAVCYDTCHGFSAGYDLRTKEVYEQTFSEFDRIVGIDRLQLFHLNDTKKEFGSKKDRHDHIGQGGLGLDPFRFLLADPRFEKVPGYLETPEDDLGGYEYDLKLLREMQV
ncbi:deoxyribonuclease IV [bacterium]|nr:deoxyribonuclease IV [bacterium]